MVLVLFYVSREWLGLAIDKIMQHSVGEIFNEHS
jgi:hypothetical protein